MQVFYSALAEDSQIFIAKKPKQTLFERGHTEGQETYENMLKVTNHSRDTNQNDHEVPSHTCQIGYHQQMTSAGEDVEKKEPSCTAGGNANKCNHCEEQYGVSSKIKNGASI